MTDRQYDFKIVTPTSPQWDVLRVLNTDIFPTDAEPDYASAMWFLALDCGVGVAFCGWKTTAASEGFHYRSGVRRGYRGNGLQARMIRRREDVMRACGLRTAVTYTEVYSSASMCTLIKCGYRPFEATEATGLAPPDRWARMVYWGKTL